MKTAETEAALMSVAELSRIIDQPETVIIDVRSEKTFNASSEKIKGAKREDPHKVMAWYKKYLQEKIIVTYCA
ncbi:MAG: hypothetical protein JRC92_01120 [Deltaproteobacteria bacterium]|nr:hypothetical protein [Deltaproteobacteria bacterium]